MWTSSDRPSSGAVFSAKQKYKLEYKAGLKRARLNAWLGPTDKASWNKIIHSEQCCPSALSCLQLANFVDHYKHMFSVFKSFLQSFYYKILKPLLPYCLLQAHIQPVAMFDIRWALRKIQPSNSIDGEGLYYRLFAYNCPALLNHLQTLFQSCLAQSLVPDSFLCGRVRSILKQARTPFHVQIIVLLQYCVFWVSCLNIYYYRKLSRNTILRLFSLVFRKVSVVPMHNIF